ncbi:MAG: FAD-dependent oxidoreductase [Myxococcota bacterium]|nr:FAD-dependent oxidoreductase [Myxococcota bacterium]
MMHSRSLQQSLPEHLKDRCTAIREDGIARRSFVLYWTMQAVRGHENPALNTAVHIANQLSIPVLVYQCLSYQHPFASDRRHRFVLEGARDLQMELEHRNIGYTFELAAHQPQNVNVQILGNMSSFIIVEDFPTPTIRQWQHQLTQSTDVPIWKVDASCIIPMSLSTEAYTQPFRFHEKFKLQKERYLTQNLLDIEPEAKPFIPSLPFRPVDFKSTDLQQLLRKSAIDHSIPPVYQTVGGSNRGYRRWKQFFNRHLQNHHRNGRDPNQQGISQLSSYLHFGHISPFRIAKEAHLVGHNGAASFVHQLFNRDFSYHWCQRIEDPKHWQALPQWARETLQKESSSPREKIYRWEELYYGRTHNRLWNLSQRSLLLHGWLHPSLQMTWGKMMLKWTQNPQQALRWLIDFNHRLSLDGQDPSSYTRLLWCLGLFDSPVSPTKPIYGAVRMQKPQDRLLDKSMYQNSISVSKETRVAIIGSGMAGLTCARILQEHGFQVELYDKARQVGGRIATRSSRKDALWRFDHGLPFFSTQDPHFRLRLLAWENCGVLQKWEGKVGLWEEGNISLSEEERFVAIDQNVSLPLHLQRDLKIHTQKRIVQIKYSAQKWSLQTETERFDDYDYLLIAIPPKQAKALLPTRLHFPSIHMEFHPQHALMLRTEADIALPWDAIKLPRHSTFSWLAKESSKPGRPDAFQWILHTQPSWSEAVLERTPEDLVPELVHALQRLLNQKINVLQHQIHRWRYSRVKDPDTSGSWFLAEQNIGMCGDWLHGGRADGAYLSGTHLAAEVLHHEHKKIEKKS